MTTFLAFAAICGLWLLIGLLAGVLIGKAMRAADIADEHTDAADEIYVPREWAA